MNWQTIAQFQHFLKPKSSRGNPRNIWLMKNKDGEFYCWFSESSFPKLSYNRDKDLKGETILMNCKLNKFWEKGELEKEAWGFNCENKVLVSNKSRISFWEEIPNKTNKKEELEKEIYFQLYIYSKRKNELGTIREKLVKLLKER